MQKFFECTIDVECRGSSRNSGALYCEIDRVELRTKHDDADVKVFPRRLLIVDFVSYVNSGIAKPFL